MSLGKEEMSRSKIMTGILIDKIGALEQKLI